MLLMLTTVSVCTPIEFIENESDLSAISSTIVHSHVGEHCDICLRKFFIIHK